MIDEKTLIKAITIAKQQQNQKKIQFTATRKIYIKQGLNQHEIQNLTNLLVKSNTEQLIATTKIIEEEIEKRVNKELGQ